MYEKLNITENHLNVLSLFTKSFNKEYYIREVQKILKISPRTAQLILNDLEKKSILKSNLRGKIRNYVLNKNILTKKYLIMSEEHKELVFLEKNPLIKEFISKIQNHVNGIMLIFGSYVKGTEKKSSDLDIFTIGKYNLEKIDEIKDIYGLEINIKNYSKTEFMKNIKDDYLIKEILEDHIIIMGKEAFFEIIWKI